METFYIFLISYSIQGYPVERTILLRKLRAQCQIAIRANEPLSDMHLVLIYVLHRHREVYLNQYDQDLGHQLKVRTIKKRTTTL